MNTYKVTVHQDASNKVDTVEVEAMTMTAALGLAVAFCDLVEEGYSSNYVEIKRVP